MKHSLGTLALALISSAALALGGAFCLCRKRRKPGGTLNFAVVSSPPSNDCHAETTFGMIHPVTPHYSLLLKIDAAHTLTSPATWPRAGGHPPTG